MMALRNFHKNLEKLREGYWALVELGRDRIAVKHRKIHVYGKGMG